MVYRTPRFAIGLAMVLILRLVRAKSMAWTALVEGGVERSRPKSKHKTRGLVGDASGRLAGWLMAQTRQRRGASAVVLSAKLGCVHNHRERADPKHRRSTAKKSCEREPRTRTDAAAASSRSCQLHLQA